MFRDDKRPGKLLLRCAPLVVALWLFAPMAAAAQQPQEPQPAPPQQEPPPPQDQDEEEVEVQVPQPRDPLLVDGPAHIVQPGAWTLTPFLGTSFGGNLQNSPLSLGLAGAYNWTSRVAFEGELGYLRAAEQGVAPRFRSSVFTGNVNALYHFVPADAAQNWAPYATIGLGFGRTSPEVTIDPFLDPAQTVMTLNAGGGVKTRIADRANLRLGMRYFNGSDLVPSFWRPYVGLTFIMNDVRN
jgi:opacity protein-like surface antigen